MFWYLPSTNTNDIPYRETITKMATENYRDKKQSGGSRQFGEVYMRIELSRQSA